MYTMPHAHTHVKIRWTVFRRCKQLVVVLPTKQSISMRNTFPEAESLARSLEVSYELGAKSILIYVEI